MKEPTYECIPDTQEEFLATSKKEKKEKKKEKEERKRKRNLQNFSFQKGENLK